MSEGSNASGTSSNTIAPSSPQSAIPWSLTTHPNANRSHNTSLTNASPVVSPVVPEQAPQPTSANNHATTNNSSQIAFTGARPNTAPKKPRSFFKSSFSRNRRGVGMTAHKLRFPRANTFSSQRQPNRPARLKRITHFGWLWEIGGLFVAAVCTCLTIAILIYMNGSPLAKWNIFIQPNSLVAVFSTVGKSALLVPIAEGISQLKWSHFEDPHPRQLSQMQVFDDASRGPWGAMVFLWKARVKSPPWLASLGALITLLLLGFEPFTQQVLEFPLRDAVKLNGTASISHITALTNAGVQPTLDEREARVSFALGLRGRLFDRGMSVPDNGQCDTQRCDLPDFTSLATCITCEREEFDLQTAQHWRPAGDYYAGCSFSAAKEDVYDFYPKDLNESLALIKDQDPSAFDTAWSARCEKVKRGYPKFFLDLGSYYHGPMVTTLSDTNIENPVSDYFVGHRGYREDYKNGQFDGDISTAMDSVSFCHVQYPEVVGTLVPVETIYPFTCFTMTSNITDLHLSNMTYGHLRKPITGHIDWCRHDVCAKKYEDVSIRNQTFHAGKVTKIPLYNPDNFKTTTPKTNATKYTLLAHDGSAGNFTIGSEARSRLAYVSSLAEFDDIFFANDPRWTKTNWTRIFDAVENTLSTLIQSRSNPDHKVSTGKAYAPQNFVEVRWEWFLLPLSTVLFSTLFLLLTMAKSAKKPYLYKTSLLAILFHGLDGWQKEELRVPKGWKKQETGWDMLKLAEASKARFTRDADGDFKIMKVD